MKEGPEIPRVGDIVMITNSGQNWAEEMNNFVGQEFVVSEVFDSPRNSRIEVKFLRMSDIMEKYHWEYECSHFRITKRYKKNLRKLKFKIS